MILLFCTFKNHYENELSLNYYELASIYKLYGEARKIMAFNSSLSCDNIEYTHSTGSMVEINFQLG